MTRANHDDWLNRAMVSKLLRYQLSLFERKLK